MIDGSLYHSIYLIVVIILTIGCSNRYASYPAERIGRQEKSSQIGLAVLAVAFILFIGLRPPHRSFVDMNNYIAFYDAEQAGHSVFRFNPDTENLLFDNLFSYLAVNDFEITLFFAIIAAIYFGGTAWALARLFPKDAFYAYVVFLAAFSTFSYSTNGIKAGAAAAIFLVAFSYRDKVWLSLLIALLSWCFHHSMYVVVAAYAVTLLLKNPKYYLGFWLVCIVLGLLHLNPFAQQMVELSDERGGRYLTASYEWGGKTGFRLDFLLYSSFPVVVGYYAIFMHKVKDALYSNLFNLYVLCNSLWILVMYVPFNNRIAYLSWFLYPVVLVYPLFKIRFIPRQYSMLNKVVWIQLAFLLFMSLIYY